MVYLTASNSQWADAGVVDRWAGSIAQEHCSYRENSLNIKNPQIPTNIKYIQMQTKNKMECCTKVCLQEIGVVE